MLVILDGRPLAFTNVIHKAGAAILAFPPGEEGRTAIAEVLTGRFARVSLHAGEKRRVTFVLDMSQAAFHGRDLKLGVEPGEMEVMIGASSDDIRYRADFHIIGARRFLRLLDVNPTTVKME